MLGVGYEFGVACMHVRSWRGSRQNRILRNDLEMNRQWIGSEFSPGLMWNLSVGTSGVLNPIHEGDIMSVVHKIERVVSWQLQQ